MGSRHAETVDPGFRAFVVRTFGDEGRAWLGRLPAVVDELSERWELELGPELPGGLLSCVRAATLADGRVAVLKIGVSPATRHEIVSLRAWAGGGAPELLAADDELQALLLERIAPGTHTDSAPVAAVAQLMNTLHVEPPRGFPVLEDEVRRRIQDAVRAGRASEQKGRWALETVSALGRDAPTPLLVHGDFDERNLLRCARRGLVAIDPLPCSGDPAYDAGYWVHGNRRPGRRARLDAIVEASGLPRERVRDWAAVVGVHG
jgi:streptomycin 6-kinase